MNRDDIHTEQAAAGRGNKESRPLRVNCPSTSAARTDLNKVVAVWFFYASLLSSFVIFTPRIYPCRALSHSFLKADGLCVYFFIFWGVKGKKESWRRGSFVASLFSKRYRDWDDEVTRRSFVSLFNFKPQRQNVFAQMFKVKTCCVFSPPFSNPVLRQPGNSCAQTFRRS